jgi:hypothetical protein
MNNVEMINLMCIFEHSSREALISDIKASLPYINDSDMTRLMVETVKTLEAMTGEEYAEIVFEPAIDDDELCEI